MFFFFNWSPNDYKLLRPYYYVLRNNIVVFTVLIAYPISMLVFYEVARSLSILYYNRRSMRSLRTWPLTKPARWRIGIFYAKMTLRSVEFSQRLFGLYNVIINIIIIIIIIVTSFVGQHKFNPSTEDNTTGNVILL